MQSGSLAVYCDPHLDLPSTLYHTSPRVPSAPLAVSVICPKSRSIRVIRISNSMVLRISVLHRSSQSCLRPADPHIRNATPTPLCGGGASHHFDIVQPLQGFTPSSWVSSVVFSAKQTLYGSCMRSPPVSSCAYGPDVEIHYYTTHLLCLLVQVSSITCLLACLYSSHTFR